MEIETYNVELTRFEKIKNKIGHMLKRFLKIIKK